MFTIVKLTPEGEFDLDLSIPTGSEATNEARALTVASGQKHQPRRRKDAIKPDWREREAKRPPMPEGWDLTPIPDHFLFPSQTHPGYVAYTPTPEYGEQDRQVRTTPGRYLNLFYSGLSEAERARLIALLTPKDEYSLCFATTEQEWEDVYVNGPHSCMAYHPTEDWTDDDGDEHESPFLDVGIHPVRIYVHPDSDVRLAYLVRNVSEEITARAIVRTGTKTFGRAYGDGYRLEKMLEDLGYVRDPYLLVGAKLQRRIYHPGEYDCFVLPYIDYTPYVLDMGDHLVVQDNSEDRPKVYTAVGHNTEGYSVALLTCPVTNTISAPWDFTPHHATGQMMSSYAPGYLRIYHNDGYEMWPEELCVYDHNHPYGWRPKTEEELRAAA